MVLNLTLSKVIETSFVPHIKQIFQIEICIDFFAFKKFPAKESFMGKGGVVNSKLSVALVVACIISAPKTNDGMLWLLGNSFRILILSVP